MTTADSIIKLRELVGGRTIGMLTSSAPSGELHSRPLTVGEIDDDGNLIMLVDATADWVLGLGHGEHVNMSFARDDDRVWVSVAGTTLVNEHKATIHRLWSPAADIFFPEGPDSPNVRVLILSTSTAEYWDAPSGRVERLGVLAKALLGDPQAKLGEAGSIELS